MNLLLSICLSVPGVCDIPDLGDYLENYLEAMAFYESAGPVERWRPLVSIYFPDEEVDTAMCIIDHESKGNPDADNPTSSARGLFQVLGSLWAPHYGVARTDLYDPVVNTRIARDIWDNYGWWAWSPYQRGACR